MRVLNFLSLAAATAAVTVTEPTDMVMASVEKGLACGCDEVREEKN
jgi:hypothetical protein